MGGMRYPICTPTSALPGTLPRASGRKRVRPQDAQVTARPHTHARVRVYQHASVRDLSQPSVRDMFFDPLECWAIRAQS